MTNLNKVPIVFRDKKRQLTLKERQQLYTQAGGKCQSCHKNLDFDLMAAGHRTAHAAGGSTTLNNSVALCFDCNKLQGTQNYEEFRYNNRIIHQPSPSIQISSPHTKDKSYTKVQPHQQRKSIKEYSPNITSTDITQTSTGFLLFFFFLSFTAIKMVLMLWIFIIALFIKSIILPITQYVIHQSQKQRERKRLARKILSKANKLNER